MFRLPLALAAALAWTMPAVAQTADPADVATPESTVLAAYSAINRAPGAPFQWDRFRSLFLPGARLIPNTEQTQGTFTTHTVESFIEWIDRGWRPVIGTERDRGFAESQVASVAERFGDVAHVFSTYQKHFWGDSTILGRGINSFQLVWKDGRWWITALAWDEETGAGPVPAKYLPPR